MELKDIQVIEGKVYSDLPHPYIMGLGIRTRDYECDVQGIVNNANYLHYLEITRHAFCEREGYDFGRMTADGCIVVMSRVEINYISSLHGNELFLSCMWVERKGPRFLFHQDLFRDGQPIVRAIATIVATREGHITKGDDLAVKLGIN